MLLCFRKSKSLGYIPAIPLSGTMRSTLCAAYCKPSVVHGNSRGYRTYVLLGLKCLIRKKKTSSDFHSIDNHSVSTCCSSSALIILQSWSTIPGGRENSVFEISTLELREVTPFPQSHKNSEQPKLDLNPTLIDVKVCLLFSTLQCSFLESVASLSSSFVFKASRIDCRHLGCLHIFCSYPGFP